MFESALIESSTGSPYRSAIWTKGISFAVEASLLVLAVLAPLIYTEALPKHLGSVIEVPAPPPGAAPRSLSVVSHATTRSELNDGQILMPSVIPHRIKEIPDEPKGPNSAPGGVQGVPFGVPGGTGDNSFAILIHNLPVVLSKSVTPHSVRVSSGVAQGLLIHQVRPQYPSLARSARIQGAVVLQAVIGKEGAIQNLQVLSGHPLLVQSALDAVRQWRYRPYLLNNEPVEVDTTITVNFTLDSAQ